MICILFCFFFVAVYVVKRVAWRFGIVDLPDQRRKVHAAPIPRLGGVAIVASVVGCFGLLLLLPLSYRESARDAFPLLFPIIPSALVVFGVGLCDDIICISPWKKLVGQLVAATLAWSGGVHVSGLDRFSLPHIASFVVTVLWIVACTNAINLIDGMDGLAAGVSVFAAATMLVAALINGNGAMAVAVSPLVGALLGFLRYNFSPATIFLGDCGSLTIGFLLGCYGALWSEKSTMLLGLAAPALALALPLLDVGLAVTRRLIQGQPIFSADRAHIHHKLLSRGLPTKRVALILYGVCGIGAVSSLMEYVSHGQYRGFAMVIVVLAGWLGVQYLGYKEFGVAGRIISKGTIRTVLSAQLALDSFTEELNRKLTLEESFELLCRKCPQFGFCGIMFNIDNVIQKWGIDNGWQARIDFPEHGHISLWRDIDSKGSGSVAVLFLDFVSRRFSEKLNDVEEVRQ